MRHRSSAWLAVAIGVTALGLLIGSARDTSIRDRDSAASRPSAVAILARTAAAISAATADSVLQMIVMTPEGVSRVIIDHPGHATELVRNRAGGTVSESGVRQLPGPAGRYERRTVNFATGTWSQSVLADTPADPGGPGGEVIDSPAEAITAQLHHALGVSGRARGGQAGGGHAGGGSAGMTRARVVREPTIDGVPAYVLVLGGPGGPPATVWISRSSWLPLQSASPGMSVSYEWTSQGTILAASLWPSVPARLIRSPPA